MYQRGSSLLFILVTLLQHVFCSGRAATVLSAGSHLCRQDSGNVSAPPGLLRIECSAPFLVASSKSVVSTAAFGSWT